jgi:hypothetical protein
MDVITYANQEINVNMNAPIKKPCKSMTCRGKSESAGARTQDPILKRDVLYLLSY